VIQTISPYLLPHLTPAIHSTYANLKIQWVEEKTAILIQSLHAGALDAALLALEAEIGDVEREVIARDRFVLVAPAGDPLGVRTGPAKPSDLRDASVLLLDDGHCFGRQALAFCSRSKARELEFRATASPPSPRWWRAGRGSRSFPSCPCLPKRGSPLSKYALSRIPPPGAQSDSSGASVRRLRSQCANWRARCGKRTPRRGASRVPVLAGPGSLDDSHESGGRRRQEARMNTNVYREADRVTIPAASGWSPHDKQSSVHAAEEAVIQALGEDVTYDYLVGMSGLAFRMQLSREGFCPSSPHPACGDSCVGRSAEAPS
jgi:hypothetical protein